MADVLIRDISSDDLQALDAQAKRVGLSRAEFLRRKLVQQARRSGGAVVVADLSWLGGVLTDLSDPAVMDGAWS